METEPKTGTKKRRRWGRLLLRSLLAIGLALSGIAFWYTHRPQPPDTTRTLFPGIVYYRESTRTPHPMVMHIVTIDLTRPEISLLITPGDKTKPRPLVARTTSQFLKEFHVQVAINADFFFPWWSRSLWDFYPHVGDPVELEGVAVAKGVVYSEGGERWKFPTLYFDRHKRGRFNRSGSDLYDAISGNVMVLKNGEPDPKFYEPPFKLDPRTAIALDKDAKTLILLVIDGRQPNYSEGAAFYQMAEILKRFGGWNAMNLDGGGSVTLVVEGANGEPVVLNSPIDNRIPGRERPVANHLGIQVTGNREQGTEQR